MSMPVKALPDTSDTEQVTELNRAYEKIRNEIGKRVIGQREVVDHLLITLFSGGHGLFVGVPGLAKTLLIQTLANVLDLNFNRIQFTPDLMPSDITGTDIIDQDDSGRRDFRFVPGPLFCNLLLADEINRTPPKTQAALLQSMQEQQVTASGKTYSLQPPFHVFATQNPIEQEGTYPLPEAQLDRFMMMLNVPYPTAEEEVEVVTRTTVDTLPTINKILGPEEILRYQNLVLRVPISTPLVEQAVALVRKTRPTDATASPDIQEYVSYGAGPRAAQHLVLASKARAILNGRTAVDREDLKSLAPPILRHRILTNFHAEAKKITPDDLIKKLLEDVLTQ